MDDRRAIKSLISALYGPLAEVQVRRDTVKAAADQQETVLDLVFASLRIKSSAWMNAFLDGKRLTGAQLVFL
jgi:hypothetical protein